MLTGALRWSCDLMTVTRNRARMEKKMVIIMDFVLIMFFTAFAFSASTILV